MAKAAGVLLCHVFQRPLGFGQRLEMTLDQALKRIHHPAHRARALEIGERLGIFRDCPTPKSCTSPFAPLWIGEMVRRAG